VGDFGGGEALRGGVGVEDPDESDLALPPPVFKGVELSLAPSNMASVVLFNCGEEFLDPNCSLISMPKKKKRLDLRPAPGTYKAVLVHQFLVGLGGQRWLSGEESRWP